MPVQMTVPMRCLKELNSLNSGEFYVEPKEGLLLIFPSWTLHYVTSGQNDTERISIAFNIKLKE